MLLTLGFIISGILTFIFASNGNWTMVTVCSVSALIHWVGLMGWASEKGREQARKENEQNN